MEEVYKNAFAEVYTLLSFMPVEYVEKVPKKLLLLVEQNRNKEYKYEVDISKKLENQKMLVETKAILWNLYRDFWCTKEQKKEILQREQKDREEYRKRMSEKFNTDNLFKKKNIQESTNSDKEMIIYKENIFTKMVNKIKCFFKINKI